MLCPQAGMHHEASLCWVCGGHTDQAVSYWARNCAGTSGMAVDVLQVGWDRYGSTCRAGHERSGR